MKSFVDQCVLLQPAVHIEIYLFTFGSTCGLQAFKYVDFDSSKRGWENEGEDVFIYVY